MRNLISESKELDTQASRGGKAMYKRVTVKYEVSGRTFHYTIYRSETDSVKHMIWLDSYDKSENGWDRNEVSNSRLYESDEKFDKAIQRIEKKMRASTLKRVAAEFIELIDNKGIESSSVRQMYAMAVKMGTQKYMTLHLEDMASGVWSMAGEIAMEIVNKYNK